MSEPREQILALVASYGPDVLDLSRTVESELHLLCPDKPDEVNSLVVALRHGVVHYLLVLAETGKLATADLPAQVRRLSTEAGLSETEAERAVNMWADIVGTIKISRGSSGAYRRKPKGLPHTALAALGPIVIVGVGGLLGSMLPWIAVLEERHRQHFIIPGNISALGTHTILNLVGAVGGFLGGALGWMLGTPLSLEFAVTAGRASVHRVIAAALAAGLGSFFGLWLGYHHVADIGALAGTLLGAGIGAFLATVFTWDR
jgi:hypothetical protein